ncbi:MAG: Rieske 2Fe-2S domain-containing protein [Pseudomonadales bacterium]|nr:Rieske 2Fe-2S domain-containing protein [Pseudomonadales bacterium]
MEQQVQYDITKRIFTLKDNNTTDLAKDIYQQPAQDYVSAHVDANERSLLFRKFPLLVCLSCEIPEPGDYHCDDFSGTPIIVVRKSDSTVAAYLNICRHRGARLACDTGSGLRQLRCPYHAWSYAADSGDLTSVPFNEGFTGLDKSDYGLIKLPVIEYGGLVFVKPEAGQDIVPTEFMSGFERDLNAFNIADYHHFESRVLVADINWKIVIDTFLETYHLNTLHRETIAPILHNNLTTFDPMGNHLRMIAVRKTIEQLRSVAPDQLSLIEHTAIVYVLFPNTVFIMQGDHLETWRVYPGDGPNQSRMHVSLYTPEAPSSDSARKYWAKNMDLLMATVLKEDFPLAEKIQKDFSIRDDNLVFGRNEPALQHFHRCLTRQLKSEN